MARRGALRPGPGRADRVSFQERDRSPRPRFDGHVAVGGARRSTPPRLPTCTPPIPAEFLGVNPPIGKGRPVPGPLKPLIAMPTTAGTGSETTGVASSMSPRCTPRRASRPAAVPSLGRLIRTTRGASRRRSPRGPAWTAEPRPGIVDRPALYRRARPARPSLRPPTRGPTRSATFGRCGRSASSPAFSSGRWATRRRRSAGADAPGGVLRRHRLWQRGRPPAARDVVPGLRPVRAFGRPATPPSSAGPARSLGDPQRAGRFPVHRARGPRAPPAGGGSARRGDRARSTPDEAGRVVAERITWFMQRLAVPNGLRAVGYTSSDIPSAGRRITLLQRRLTTLSPRPAGLEELTAMFEDAMVAW